MNKIRYYIGSRFKLVNCIFSCILAYIICFPIYKILYPISNYTNLNDFYVSTSIYNNHNKYLDIIIVFIYIILFYLFYFSIKFKDIKLNLNITKYKNWIYALTIILSLILFLSFKVNLSLLPTPDSHHYGEKFATYWLHIKYSMKYYSDIMLVHGFIDIIPSLIADKIFGDLSIYNERIANSCITLCYLMFNLILSFCIFKEKILTALLSSFFVIYIFNTNFDASISFLPHINMYVLSYIILLKNTNTRYKFLWNIVYLAVSSLVITTQTTLGSFCVVASLPFFIEHFKLDFKKNSLFWGTAIILTSILFKENIIAFFQAAQYYVTSNLFAFSNEFPQQFSFGDFLIFTFFISSILLIPILINISIIENDKEYSNLAIFALLFILLPLNYSLGRIDNIYLPRLQVITLTILTIIIPYILLKKKRYYLDLYSILLVVAILSFYSFTHYYPRTVSLNIQSQYSKQTDFIQKNSTNFDTLLDLNNDGMIYYHAKRKAAIPNTSFFNIVNTKQTEQILKILKENPPKLICLYSQKKLFHDNVRIPERINKIYRWIFLSGNYKSITNDDNTIYLIYNPEAKISFTKDMDSIGVGDLKYLPDAWGASIRTLPLQIVNTDLSIKGNSIFIRSYITPLEADLLYIEFENTKDIDIKLKMNKIESVLNFKTRANKILIPIDSYPSWLLEKKIMSFTLYANDIIKIKKAELYKRK